MVCRSDEAMLRGCLNGLLVVTLISGVGLVGFPRALFGRATGVACAQLWKVRRYHDVGVVNCAWRAGLGS